MRVDTEDFRPISVLGRDPLSPGMFAGGLVAVLLAHILPLLGWFVYLTLEAMGILGSPEPPRMASRHVVEARFVQLGKKPDPKRLPKRKVPRKSTSPDLRKVVSTDPREPPPEPPKKKEPPKDAVEDLLERLGDRAQAFSEIAEEQEKEGDPEGIEEGTETDTAKAGDLYVGKLYALFRRGWTVPTTLKDDELQDLAAAVAIDISDDARIAGFRMVQPSGNPLFDQSVLDRVGEVQSHDTKLPEPPPEVAEDFLGQTIALRFLGRNAR